MQPLARRMLVMAARMTSPLPPQARPELQVTPTITTFVIPG
jgi:hypothetical protein